MGKRRCSSSHRRTWEAYLAYKAYFSIKRNIEFLDKEMKSMKDTDAFDMMIDFDKKLTKIINKYLKEQWLLY